MKRYLRIGIYTSYSFFSFFAGAQSNISISVPVIWSDIKIKDNWTPSSAPYYKEYIRGSSLGHGINVSYSFTPMFIFNDKHFSVNIHTGYFKQRFDIERPFNYNSPLYVAFYTDHYSYNNWHGALGLTYTYSLQEKLFLSGNLTYNIMHSFRQEYTPTYSVGTDFFTQVNESKIHFGKMLSLGIGLKRRLADRFSMELLLFAPIYTRWRNDRIFDDDPSTFSSPGISVGSSLNVSYYLKQKK